MKSTNIRRQRSNENKKRLIAAASVQFQRYGYLDTTLESIAEEAGFHVQTLYRHFPKKNDLALALLEKNLDEFIEFMEAREKNALAAWRDWIEINAKESQKRPASGMVLPEIPGFWHRYEAAFANEIAHDMGVDTRSDLRPMLVACMLVSANKHAAEEMTESGRTKNWVADLLNVIDVAIAYIASSLGLNGEQDHGRSEGDR